MDNSNEPDQNKSQSSRRGFAAMDPDHQKEIATQKDIETHQGVADKDNTEAAKPGGKKIGQNSSSKRKDIDKEELL